MYIFIQLHYELCDITTLSHLQQQIHVLLLWIKKQNLFKGLVLCRFNTHTSTSPPGLHRLARCLEQSFWSLHDSPALSQILKQWSVQVMCDSLIVWDCNCMVVVAVVARPQCMLSIARIDASHKMGCLFQLVVQSWIFISFSSGKLSSELFFQFKAFHWCNGDNNDN